jgi:hypothetical protein
VGKPAAPISLRSPAEFTHNRLTGRAGELLRDRAPIARRDLG